MSILLEPPATGESTLKAMTLLSTIMRSMLIVLWLSAGVGAWTECAWAATDAASGEAALSHEQGNHDDAQHCAVECLSKISASPSLRQTPQPAGDHPEPAILATNVALLPVASFIQPTRWYEPPPAGHTALHDLATVRLLI